MIDGIEAFYQRIADSMTAELPEGWSTARIDAVFFPRSSRYEAEYVRQPDGLSRSFSPTLDGGKAFREIRKALKAAGKDLWGRASFELRPDGTFNMRWGYDDCDANGDALFDEEQERRRAAERHRLTS
jgi:hypothetical protein